MSIGPFPSFPQMNGSAPMLRDNLLVTTSDAGDVHVQSLYPTPKHSFALKLWLHTPPSSTDMATLMQHYIDNRLLPFSFTWAGDGNSYVCLYAAPPTFDTTNNPAYIMASVTLLEV